MEWFNFFFHYVSTLTQGILQIIFVGRFTKKQLKIPHILLYLLSFYILDATAATDSSSILAVVLHLLLLYAASHFVLKNSKAVSWVAAILAVYLCRLSFGIINALESILLPAIVHRPWLLYTSLSLWTIAAFTLCAGCYVLILKWFTPQEDIYAPYIYMLLPLCLFFFAMEFYLTYTVYERPVIIPAPIEAGKHLALLALQVLGLSALFCVLYAYKQSCGYFQSQAALAALKQQIHAQKTYVAQAKLCHQQTLSFRHDIKNHFIVLEGLLKKGHLSQAQQYLQKLQATVNGLSFPYYTGNPVVDILLEDKLSLARSNGVDLDISVIFPKAYQIDDFDLCVIVANALDNALQACMKVSGSKSIQITGKQQGNFYMLEFKNTCLNMPLPPAGTGLSNIKTVAEKYGGTITVEKSNSSFCLNVLLNISIRSKDSSLQTT